jgi:diguanylate cyclase (GGDEF)-like protein/PAS domain S-box-containing protein
MFTSLLLVSVVAVIAISLLVWQRRYLVKLQADLRVFNTLFERVKEGVLITDKQKNIAQVNPAFTFITGYSAADVIGHNPKILSSGMQSNEFYQVLWQTIHRDGVWEGELWNRDKTGRAFLQKTTIVDLASLHHPTIGFMAIQSDVTSLITHEQALKKLLHFDALTGLPNRLQLIKHLQIALNATNTHQHSVAVLFIDLDGFKLVNDRFGHELGDQVLIDLAKDFKRTLGEHSFISRVGGDEFVAVISELRHRNEINKYLNKLQRTVTEVGQTLSEDLILTSSVGVTLAPENQGEAEQLIRHADFAMYQAKQAGPNRVEFFDLDEDKATKYYRRLWVEIEQGFANSEFALHYQPKINMRTGSITGVEALIRWMHPERGLVMPMDFLPFIERSHLLEQLDQWVITQALCQLSAWRKMGLTWQLSINLSARSLQQASFVAKLTKQLHNHGADLAKFLEIEVLETSALEDMDHVIGVIKHCHELGVRFALDDFGTGYSSLQYLRDLPVDIIKIDQSFVRKMLQDPNDLSIVGGVVSLCRVFNRQVIAEGVETAEHGEVLMLLGCELAQGYGIARPMSVGDLMVWQAQWQVKPFGLGLYPFMFGRGDLTLLRAEVEHRVWVEHVYQYVMGKHQDYPELSAENCQFGRWLANQDTHQQAHCEELHRLHQAIHVLATELISWCQSGEQSVAQGRLAALFSMRDQLLNLMRALNLQQSSRKSPTHS